VAGISQINLHKQHVHFCFLGKQHVHLQQWIFVFLMFCWEVSKTFILFFWKKLPLHPREGKRGCLKHVVPECLYNPSLLFVFAQKKKKKKKTGKKKGVIPSHQISLPIQGVLIKFDFEPFIGFLLRLRSKTGSLFDNSLKSFFFFFFFWCAL
jgi:hypothetical protein